MGRYLKPIGGEFWFESQVFDNDKNNFSNSNAVFLDGGQCAIDFITDEIGFKTNEVVLVPSYLCPTMLYNFDKKHISYIFYEINEDFSINLEDIKDKEESLNVKAILLIDYFGFFHNDNTIELFNVLKQKGIIIIEDAVQLLWFEKLKKFIGNYVFNSYRKFLPIDGSIVLCEKSKSFYSINSNYNFLINKARRKKTEYIKYGIGREEEFLKLFDKAYRAYYKVDGINGMNDKAKENLNKVNYKLLKQIRLNNYNYIYDRLEGYEEIKIIFDKKLILDNVPIGFPILINNRNLVRERLRKHLIYCPVHWELSCESWLYRFNKSSNISSNILTLPIDHRYNLNDMDRLVDEIIKLLIGSEFIRENI